MKERGRKKQSKRCKGDHSPPPTSKQMPSQFPSNSYLPNTLPPPGSIFISERDVIWHLICLRSAEVSCPGCVLSPLLAYPQPAHRGKGAGEKEKTLTLCKCCLAIAKKPGAVSALVQSQIQYPAPRALRS